MPCLTSYIHLHGTLLNLRDDITTYFNVDAFTNFKVLAKDEIIYDGQQIQIIFVHEGLAAAFGSILNQKDLDFDAGASVFELDMGKVIFGL